MAIGHTGSSQLISLLTELSTEAQQCNLYFDQAVETTLEDFPWPLATKYGTLALVTDNSDVTTPYDWLYGYRYPTDCIHVRRIVTVLGRNDPNPPPWRPGLDDQGRLIWTDVQDTIIEYTQRVTDVNLFSPLFVDAVSWRLAAYIAPSLSRIPKMDQTAMGIYVAILGKAKVQAGNEQQQSEEPESAFIRARE
jgi:hypothetical protein